jgi:hypothetical protein
MGAATLGALALAVLMVLWPTLSGSFGGTPVLGRMDDALPGSLWSNWWVQQWWLGEQELFYSEMIFWPQGAELVPMLGNLGASMLSVPFQSFGAYPEYWNRWIGFCMLANGLASYWLARTVGADRVGALLAGLCMTLALPILVEINGGHQSQFLMAGLPICIVLSLRVLDLDRWWDAWLLGLALLVTSLVWWVLGWVAWALLLSLAGHRAWCFRHQRRNIWDQLWRTFRIWLPCLLMAGPLFVQANRDELKGMGWGRLIHDTADTQVEDLMLVSLLEHSVAPLQLLTGDVEGLAALLGASLVLGMLALWMLYKRTRARLWGPLLVGSCLLSLGPYLHPSAGFSQDWLVLPTGWLQALIPFATRFHQPDRMLIVAVLALAIMISLVYRPLVLSLPGRLRGLPLGVALLAIIGMPWAQDRLPLDVYDFDMPGWYKLLGDEGVMIEVPMGMSEVPAMYQPLHGRAVATGPGVVREMVDADGYRSLVHTDPGINKLWEFNPMSTDASDLMHLREEGLRYVVVNSGVIEYLIQSQGMDRARVMLLVSRWLDDMLGPPVISAYQARVYRLPDEKQGAQMLEMQAEPASETYGPERGNLGIIEEEEPQPAFDDIEEAFSPDYPEP